MVRSPLSTFLVLGALLVLLVSPIIGGQKSSGDPLGILGLYLEYESPPLTWNMLYASEYLYLTSGPPPNVILLAKYYNTEFYKSVIDKWGDYILRMWRFRSYLRDPYFVNSALSEYFYDMYKKGYTFRCNLSIHVVGFDGEYYDVVLRLKIDHVYYKNISLGIKTWESPVIEERIKVSYRDRSILYNGLYAGVWPFFLLPHELYEGSRVLVSDLILYKLYNVSLPIDGRIVAELRPETIPKEGRESEFLKRYWSDLERYFREVVGITIRPESTLQAKISYDTKDPYLIDQWMNISFTAHNRFYESLGFTHPNPYLGKATGVSFTIMIDYDVRTGVAYYITTLSFPIGVSLDPLSYVIPLEVDGGFGGSTCGGTWVLRSLTFKTPVVTEITTVNTIATTTVTQTQEATGAQAYTTTQQTIAPNTTTITDGKATTPSPTIATKTPIVTSVIATGVQRSPTVTTPIVTRTPQEPTAPSGGLVSTELLLIALIGVMILALIASYYRSLRGRG